MIYLQPITFYTILRDRTDLSRTEIAEHPDGSMKAYAARYQANDALAKMPDRQGWRVDEILMVPPPLGTAPHRATGDYVTHSSTDSAQQGIAKQKGDKS
jgi:hypothetical protein